MKFLGIIILISVFQLKDSYAGLYQLNSKWNKLDFNVCFLDKPKDLYRNELIFSFETKEIIKREASLFKKEIRERVNKTVEEEKIIPFPDNYKDFIRDTVKQSYEEIGLRFNGWLDCSKVHDADLIIVFSDVSYAYLATGAIGDPAKDPRLLNKKANSIRINSGYITRYTNEYKTLFSELSIKHNLNIEIDSLAQRWALNTLLSGIVHEVGHFLGLEHEHMIKSGYEEMKQVDISNNYRIFDRITRDNSFLDLLDIMAKQDSLQTLVQIGSYDPFSVMSYIWQGIHPSIAKVDVFCDYYSHDDLCNNRVLDFLSLSRATDKSRLSPHDILVLKSIYHGENYELAEDDYKDIILWIGEFRESILRL